MKTEREEKNKFSHSNAILTISILCNVLNGIIETYTNIIHLILQILRRNNTPYTMKIYSTEEQHEVLGLLFFPMLLYSVVTCSLAQTETIDRRHNLRINRNVYQVTLS